MSELNRLIQKLCPNGVKYVPIWSVTAWDKNFNAVEKSKQAKVVKYHYLLAKDLRALAVDGGDVKLLSTGDDDYGYTTEEIGGNLISDGEIVAIPWGGNANVQYYKGKFITSDNRIATALDTSVLDNKYLYYCMLNRQSEIASYYRGSGIKHPSMRKVLDLEIPLPPLKIQQEIVKILDKFTQLQAELQAELDLRLKQYEHYRDDLLSFDGLSASVGGVPKVRLGDIVDYEQPTKYLVETAEYDDSYATPVLTAGKTFILGYTDEVNGVYVASAEDPVIIFDDFTTDSKWVDFPFKVKSSAMKMLKLSDNGQKTTLLRWVYLCMQRLNYAPMDHARHWISKYSNLEIPLPSLDVQKRLVNVLDNFDAICSDLKIGLPAEITLRQQQYEYYRDQLLTFAETGRIIFTDRQTDRREILRS